MTLIKELVAVTKDSNEPSRGGRPSLVPRPPLASASQLGHVCGARGLARGLCSRKARRGLGTLVAYDQLVRHVSKGILSMIGPLQL